MDTIVREIQVFKFDELSEEAQTRVIEKYCQSAGEYFDPDWLLDHCADIGELIGLDLRMRKTTRGDGSTGWRTSIYWSGFWSQGDGACFDGSYEYKKGALAAVKKHAPADTDLHGIVQQLQDIQRRAFYKLTARIKHSGHYYHSGCMAFDIEGYPSSFDFDAFKQCFRDFADLIYQKLSDSYDYETSEKCAREYLLDDDDSRFLANGSRYY